jgi:hypothetical protein
VRAVRFDIRWLAAGTILFLAPAACEDDSAYKVGKPSMSTPMDGAAGAAGDAAVMDGAGGGAPDGAQD